MSYEALFGWMSVLNIGMLALYSLLWMVAGDAVIRLQSRMLGVTEDDARVGWYRFLGHYKLLILVFNLAPYIALRITAAA